MKIIPNRVDRPGNDNAASHPCAAAPIHMKGSGSSAVPTTFSETHSAPETNTLDDREISISQIDKMNLYQVPNDLSLTRHACLALAMRTSRNVGGDLGAQEHDALTTRAIEGRDARRKASRATSGATLAKAIGAEALGFTMGELERIRGQ